ncbi:MAG TPA: hypothetical protein VKR82_15995 [Candidatus Acidoferrales bacterium]|nr:hypothetical protein [Candidatus Acidoferrales bacterium]
MSKPKASPPKFNRALLHGALLCALGLAAAAAFAAPADAPEIMPVAQVKAGMKGVVYTIFSGDTIDKVDLVVLGVLPDLIGPQQPIILVQLLGDKVEHTGVVAGMSGSPVFIDGKLVGALSLKFGSFSKDPLAGVTPFQNMLEVTPVPAHSTATATSEGTPDSDSVSPPRYELPNSVLSSNIWPKSDTSMFIGGAYLTPIETPLVFSGINPGVLSHFAPELAGYGLVAVQGGAGEPQPDDANLVPGDMVSVVFVKGDMTAGASCTVTAITADRVYACGHPIFGFGDVQFPMARARVVTTLSSSADSTKIVTTGGTIGTLSEDRLTAIMGTLDKGPKMIPMDLHLITKAGERNFHFSLADNPKITPLLVNIVAMNGLTSNTTYSEGTTLRLSGEIEIAGHSPVQLENMFAPTDSAVPDAAFVVFSVQNLFARIFTNPYEVPKVEHIRLNLESLPERRFTTIEGAWTDTAEAVPGQTIQVKVLLRPYRGAPELKTIPITIPLQTDRGTTLRLQVSDSVGADRTTRPVSALATVNQAGSLEQFIRILNRERRNDRLYITLLQPTTTLLLEDKELPNAPLSAVNVLGQRRGSPNATTLRESLAGEWSLPTEGVVSGGVSLSIRVR